MQLEETASHSEKEAAVLLEERDRLTTERDAMKIMVQESQLEVQQLAESQKKEKDEQEEKMQEIESRIAFGSSER